MKIKNIFALIIMVVISTSLLVGCSNDRVQVNTGEEQTEEEEKSGKTDTVSDDKEDKEAEDDVENAKEGWTTLSGQNAEVYSDDNILISPSSEQVILLKDDGSVRRTVELKGDLALDKDAGDVISCVSGNKIVYCKYSDSSDPNKQNLYLYDIDEEKWTLLDSIELYSHIDCIDGDVYVDFSKYDNESGKYFFSTVKYTVSDAGQVESEEVYKNINRARTEKSLSFQTGYYGDIRTFTTAYCINRYDFALYTNGNTIYFYNEDGLECNTVKLDDDRYPSVMCYDGNRVIFEAYNPEDGSSDIYCYDLNTLETAKLDIGSSVNGRHSLVVIGLSEDIVYLCDNDFYSIPVTINVYGYDIKKNKLFDVVSESSMPGHTYLGTPIINSFKVIGDKVFYVAEGNTATEWFCLRKEGTHWDKKALGVLAHEYSYTRYATIESTSSVENCPYCGTVCYDDYYEWPVFNRSVKNADIINKVFEDRMTAHKRSTFDYVPTFTEDDCKNYIHKGDICGYDGDDFRVYEIREVLDHYLFVEQKGYEMAAGAVHGMPYQDNLLFDLNTGKEVQSLSEIFDVSETRLKELVAEAARKDCEESYMGKYFADSDDVYRQAYDETSLEFGSYTFYDDYMTFDFGPYDLGPFSSGTISLKVYYKDL